MSTAHYSNTRRVIAPFSTATGKVQWLGITMLGIIVLLAVMAPLFAGYLPRALSCAPFETPSAAHILGCDDAGYDIWSQLLYGARVSLIVGLSVATVSTVIATAVAILVGYHGGWVDRLVMRFIDVVQAMPFMPLVIVLGVYFGASIQTQIIVIALVMWASPVRELRAQILSIRSAGYVEASIAMGAGGWFVGLKHILPEIAPLIVPQFVRIALAAIMVETSLSFLGLGDPLQNSWGSILFHANARAAFLTGTWIYWILPPGIAVSLTVLALAFIGFGYDASLAPRIKVKKQALPLAPAHAAPQPGAALSAQGLTIVYDTEFGTNTAVKACDLTLQKGELLGLVGESGSGKTTLSLAILRLLRHPARVTHGAVWLGDDDLLAKDAEELRALRGRKIALIPQSAMNALNPVLTIGAQIEEALERGDKLPSDQKSAKVNEWLGKVGLQTKHANSYAHELSGGMRQRAVIAIALCNTPEVVIADEPTTGLDVLVQEEIMQLLLNLRQSLNLSILFVTHNLPLIARHADRLAVMYQGELVDLGAPESLRTAALHAHTRALFDNLPEIDDPKLWPQGVPNGDPVIAFTGVTKTYYPNSVLGLNLGAPHKALNDVSFTLRPGEKLGLVGGSGAGKSTLARLVMGMIKPDSGTIAYNGAPLGAGRTARKTMARAVHMVFQDPYQSIRNRMSIRDIIAEPLRIHGERDDGVIARKVAAALAAVRLPSDGHFMSRRPVQLSGGQRQRVAFARALVCDPKVIIADEPTSMLDQSVRMEIVQLMEDLRREYGTAFLFITHDIALARHFCDRLIVLSEGRIVEHGDADAVVQTPQHDYTRKLIAAA
ncbi:nickel ABC transporter ATP-binding protein NikE [Devosia sp. MC1541]|uniref:ABC transporter ATP-binding protein/permease n=1 Tax=Devosia sp. MC1541 TaxID=2725264 RepID=UPI00145F24FF|nr:nickel ABC transporter ATP-binding protein NikE [Devosia sp. MC1541]